MMAARHEDYVTIARQANRELWQAWLTLKGLQNEWNAQDLGNTLDLDENGENGHLNAAQVGAVVFDTANAIDTAVMQVGHSTNITNLL
jgi:hypothetical protein